MISDLIELEQIGFELILSLKYLKESMAARRNEAGRCCQYANSVNIVWN